MKPDKWYVSYRLYAAILAIIGVILGTMGIDFTTEAQISMAKQLEMAVQILIPLITGILALVSKIRESKKYKNVK